MIQNIIDISERVLSECKGRDIFETAEISGANVWFRPIGGLKGFYIFENGKRYIVINDALESAIKKVVCAHELGHDMLHRELSAGGIREGTLFLDTDKTEREANLFAACMLISDEDILEQASFGADISTIASVLDMPVQLVKYKLEIMNFKGYKFNVGDVNNNFLK